MLLPPFDGIDGRWVCRRDHQPPVPSGIHAVAHLMLEDDHLVIRACHPEDRAIRRGKMREAAMLQRAPMLLIEGDLVPDCSEFLLRQLREVELVPEYAEAGRAEPVLQRGPAEILMVRGGRYMVR